MSTYNYTSVTVGTAWIAIGVVIVLGIWFPRLRGHHTRTGIRIPLGILSSASAALLPCSWGVLFVWLGFHPAVQSISVLWFVIPFVLAVVGNVVGFVRDRR